MSSRSKPNECLPRDMTYRSCRGSAGQSGKNIKVCVPVILHPRLERERESRTHTLEICQAEVEASLATKLLWLYTWRGISGDFIRLLRIVLGAIERAGRLVLANSRRSHATIYATG
jgi:hypothetical protein